MNAQSLVAKVWNFAHVLRDQGVSYQVYISQISYLLFLKMDEERVTQIGEASMLPEGAREKRNFPWRFNAIWVVQSCLEKYFASGIPQISGLIRPVPFPRGAYRDRHERGAGLRWTRGAERNCLRRRTVPLRTAKLCGPGAPTLALSSRIRLRMTVAKEPGHRGATVFEVDL